MNFLIIEWMLIRVSISHAGNFSLSPISLALITHTLAGLSTSTFAYRINSPQETRTSSLFRRSFCALTHFSNNSTERESFGSVVGYYQAAKKKKGPAARRLPLVEQKRRARRRKSRCGGDFCVRSLFFLIKFQINKRNEWKKNMIQMLTGVFSLY